MRPGPAPRRRLVRHLGYCINAIIAEDCQNTTLYKGEFHHQLYCAFESAVCLLKPDPIALFQFLLNHRIWSIFIFPYNRKVFPTASESNSIF